MISSVCVCIYCTTKMTEMVPSHGEAGGRGKKDARFTQACESLSYCVLGVWVGIRKLGRAVSALTAGHEVSWSILVAAGVRSAFDPVRDSKRERPRSEVPAS